MATDAMKAIQSLIMAQFGSDFAHREGLGAKPVVTVSRDYGSGGREIATMLARQLDVPTYDRELLDAVAQKTGTRRQLVEELDEKTRGFWDSWIMSILSGENLLEDNYRRYLVKAVLDVLNTGGVIVGRGAHVILASRSVFRVRIVASPEVCARRIAARKNIPLEEARDQVAQKNKGRSEFVWTHFKSRLNDPTAFDLVINTDHLERSEDVVEIILFAMARYYKKRQ
jgi:cytidylate kinase